VSLSHTPVRFKIAPRACSISLHDSSRLHWSRPPHKRCSISRASHGFSRRRVCRGGGCAWCRCNSALSACFHLRLRHSQRSLRQPACTGYVHTYRMRAALSAHMRGDEQPPVVASRCPCLVEGPHSTSCAARVLTRLASRSDSAGETAERCHHCLPRRRGDSSREAEVRF